MSGVVSELSEVPEKKEGKQGKGTWCFFWILSLLTCTPQFSISKQRLHSRVSITVVASPFEPQEEKKNHSKLLH